MIEMALALILMAVVGCFAFDVAGRLTRGVISLLKPRASAH